MLKAPPSVRAPVRPPLLSSVSRSRIVAMAALVFVLLAPSPARAAVALAGAGLSLLSALPFIGILLTIALGPP